MVPQATVSYRRDAAPQAPTQSCTGCGSSCWADLRTELVWELLEERDSRWRVARDRFLEARAWRWTKVAALLTSVTALVGMAQRSSWSPWWWAVLLMVSVYCAAELWVGARRRGRPARWRRATPRGRRASTRRGQARADDPSTQLVAPLTGRPCLAYEVAIAEGPRPEGVEATWLVLEQEATPLRVASQRFDGARVRLDLPRTAIRASSGALQGFLHRRGLWGSTTDLVIYETILESGDDVEIHEHRRGGATLRRAAAR